MKANGPSSLEPKRPLKRCVFELIYFARPDSEVFGRSVHAARVLLGEALAEQDLGGAGSVDADIVIPVPDSGNISAIGYARKSGLPFDFGLARSHYAGRSFILPTKDQRELMARLKLHAVPEVVAGKRVIMIDDSLVRGTTSRIIVGLLREAGAKEVHLRLAAPELKWPCYYGIDIPDRDALISNRLDPEGIAREIGADSVRFLPVSRLLEILGEARNAIAAADRGFCSACFDGHHPFPLKAGNERKAHERTRLREGGRFDPKGRRFRGVHQGHPLEGRIQGYRWVRGGRRTRPARLSRPGAALDDGRSGDQALGRQEARTLRTIGIDLVAMSVNDLVVCGARPIQFLDYIACGKIDEGVLHAVIEGVVAGCEQAGCELTGGETAEMPDVYGPDDIDLAGFSVGIVEKNKMLPRLDRMEAGDLILGMPSTGVHSNGYSLARKAVDPEDRATWQELLVPTKIYVRELLELISTGRVLGAAHITGSGLHGNVERVLPRELRASFSWDWPVPPIFAKIQSGGKISDDEMRSVFNMGIGMAVIAKREEAEGLVEIAASKGIALFRAGELVRG